MTTAIIPILSYMTLGTTFDFITYQKGNAEIYDPNVLKGNVQVIDRSFTRSQYKLVETSTEAREFLDVSGALSLRIKKGDVKVDGTGDYLQISADRQKFVELLIRVQHETVTETIPSHVKPKLEWMSMRPESVGTHYVRSITYGGQLIASLRLKARNTEEREKIKAAVSANLQLTGTFDLNANGSFDKLRQDLAGMYNEEIIVVGTKNPSSPTQTLEDLMKLVAEYPEEIKGIEGGKGTRLKAELYPLSSLKANHPEYLPNSAVNALLNDVETKYDDIRSVMNEIFDWYAKVGFSPVKQHNEGDSDDDDDDDDGEVSEDERKINEMFKALKYAQSAFHVAISDLDVSINGKPEQFKEAFKAYGSGKDNIPNRFHRWFWRLRHEITNETIVWEKPPGSGGVYINWGSDKCESSSIVNPDVELLYKGRAAGALSKSWGGGRNYECLKNTDPSLSGPLTPLPKAPYVDAVNFRTFTNPDKSQPIVCAACLVKNTVSVKTFYGLTSCPKNWRKEYSGLAMADFSSFIDMDFMCLNKEAFDRTPEDDEGPQISKINPVWMNCKNCDGDKVVPCTVCSYETKTPLF